MKPAVSDEVEFKVPAPAASIQKFALKALPILLYTLVIVLYTWPLLLHLSDHTPGRFSDDRGLNLEYMWWVKQALTRYHVNPYFTDFLYYPQGVSLYLHTTFLAGAIIALPFQLLWGAVVAFNLLYFIGVVGGAWGAYCLAYYLLANRKAAFLAGLIFAFSPWLNFTSDQNQMNYLLIPWIPFFVLWLIKYLRALYPEYEVVGLTPRLIQEFNPTRKYQLRYRTLAAIFLTLAAFSGHYIFIYTVFMGAGVALWYLVNLAIGRKWWIALDLLLKLGLVVIPALVAYLPLLLGIIKEIRSGDFRATSTGFEAGLDIAGLVLPSTFHGDNKGILLHFLGYTPYGYMLSVGLVALILGIIGLFKVGQSRLWLVLFLIALVLALGTNFTFNGTITPIPLPGALLTPLPVFNALRDASRWIIPASLALSIGAGYGLCWLLERKTFAGRSISRANLLYGLVLVLFFIENQPQPVAWEGWQIPAVPAPYTNGTLNKPGALLELPVDERNNDKSDNSYYQIFHERPILGGYLARPPVYSYADSPFSFFYEEYLLADKDVIKPTSEEIRSFLSYYKFAYIVLYKAEVGQQRQKTFLKMIEGAVGPAKTGCSYEDSQILICPVEPPEQARPFLSLAKGWYKAESDAGGQRWLYGQEGFLGGFVPADGSYNLTFNAAAYLKPRKLQIEVDGQVLATQEISLERQNYSLPLKLSAGNHLIRLYSPEAPDRPSNNGSPSDSRTLTLLFSNVKLEAS